MTNNKYHRERIVLVDALRGFALMGLFIVHMVEYFELYWYRPEPGWVHNLIFFLFGGKAYGIFAMLFGLSYYIILDNYEKRGSDLRWRFTWRVTLLLFIGYIHSLLYAGDILQLLALCGFLLVLTHTLSNTSIIAIAAFCLCQIPTGLHALAHYLWQFPNYAQPAFIQLMGNNFEVFANGSFSELLSHNLAQGQLAKWSFFIETGRLWNIIGLMFTGVYLGRIQFFEKLHPQKHLFLSLMAFIFLFALLKFASPFAINHLAEGMGRWSIEQIFVYLQNLFIIASGIAMFMIIFYTSAGRRLLSLWAPAGRMTLSFYLLQSLVFVPVFYGFGLRGFASIGQVNALALGIICWILQMGLASLCLKYFRYGPMEKLWRVASFYKFKKTT